MVLSASPGEWRAAVLRAGTVWGLDWYWPDRPNLVGAVFGVRVLRLAPAARGAFVAIDGQGGEGFLDLGRYRGTVPHEGERLLAQVTRMPEAGKRLTLSPTVRLAGRYLVYTPFHAGVSASRQLPREVARGLQGAVKRMLQPAEGAIVRAAARHMAATPERLLAEVERHRSAWAAVCHDTRLGLLHAPPSLAESLLLERAGTDALTVIADSPSAQAAVRSAANAWLPGEPVTVLLDTAAPFATHGGEEAMDLALGAEVPLNSGGTLWLEHTRACWAADVDSGQAQGQVAAVRGQINREAAVELARQVRLRQAAGAFVVDFLHMDRREDQDAIVRRLHAAFAEDAAPLHFNAGFDPQGLYAFSRGRVAPPLSSRLDDGGLRQAVLAGLRALVRNALADPRRRLALHLSPAANAAAGELPLALAEAERQLGVPPWIVADAGLAPTAHAVRPAE